MDRKGDNVRSILREAFFDKIITRDERLREKEIDAADDKVVYGEIAYEKILDSKYRVGHGGCGSGRS